ncbi:glucose dehydrogenase [FAD, quinone]-like [Amphiura filiformis]|uniref:glucose dehydrogenase [FAD, quinone]-like n=1 Tax=Amphiura filiformis TaxID=82378 RepID=UPI003B213897
MESCFERWFSDNLSRPYDYIVIGGGTAGCVVASRLTEDPEVTVLLLEAGGWDDKSEIHIPAEASSLRQTNIDWKYLTISQSHACKAKLGERDEWSSGKVIGGCSSIDNMYYARGHEADFNSWASLGADGWSWEEVLPFFIHSEGNVREDFKKSPSHNNNGHLRVSDNAVTTNIGKTFVKAARELGYQQRDLTSAMDIGVGIPQATTSNGKRCSTATAYLKIALERPNLAVITNALVQKVVICNNQAIGVHVTVDKKERDVRVLREVILSAGTIESPKGILSSNGIEGTALLRTGVDPLCEWPDIQLNFIPMFFHLGNDEPTLTRYKSLSYDNMMDYSKWEALRMKKEGVTFLLILLHPKSKGELTLQKQDPEAPPNIDPRYLEHDQDVAILKKGMREVKRLLDTNTMRKSKIELCDVRLPGEPLAFSDENLDAYIRHFTSTANSPVGTCKMGAINDRSAVVDPQLRVRGIHGLRVIDASIMPHLPSANSSAPTIMIAEKGVAYITNEHDDIIQRYKQSTGASL